LDYPPRVRGGAQAVDIEIQAKEIMYHKANLNRIMAECTSQPIEQARPALRGAARTLTLTMAERTGPPIEQARPALRRCSSS
jgi:ATP-dependent protease ClpP protease subunit